MSSLQSPRVLGVVREALTAISKGSEGGTEDMDTLRGFLEWVLKQLGETAALGRRRRWLTVADSADTWTLTVDIATVYVWTEQKADEVALCFSKCLRVTKKMDNS